MGSASELTLDEATLEENITKHNNIIDSLKFFSKRKNFTVLLSLFFFTLMIYFDFYVFAFLAEKFDSFKIQHVLYVVILAGLLGYVIFSLFLVNASRKKLNFAVSGGIFALSLILALCSKTLGKFHVDVVGFASLCNCWRAQ